VRPVPLKYSMVFVVDREEAHRRAVLGRHVGDRRAVGQRRRLGAFAEELDELADHLLLAQDLGDGQHEVGRGDAFAQRPVSSKPTTSGVRKYTGWPSMPASASMPPTPQPTTPMPLIIVVWLSVPTRLSG
jgi:hypothetical protein